MCQCRACLYSHRIPVGRSSCRKLEEDVLANMRKCRISGLTVCKLGLRSEDLGLGDETTVVDENEKALRMSQLASLAYLQNMTPDSRALSDLSLFCWATSGPLAWITLYYI